MNCKLIKSNIVVVVFLLFANVVFAQRELYNWQLTPYVGLLQIDKKINLPEDANQFAYGLRLDRRLGNDFTLGLNVPNLYLGDTTNRNITGVFLSLGYNWDNGYLLNDRALLSLFHRVEAGYATRYAGADNISEKNSDAAFGFENGIKIRFGDRISADLAYTLYASRSNLTEGNIKETVHYNVFRLGISYFFKSRKSTYIAPVFVPRKDVQYNQEPQKIEPKAEGRWIIPDSVYNEEVKTPKKKDAISSPMPSPTSAPTPADSIKIYMHFDSLYIRRSRMNDLIQKYIHVDSLKVDTGFHSSPGTQGLDSTRLRMLTPHDTLRQPKSSDTYQPIDTMALKIVPVPADTIFMEEAHRDTKKSEIHKTDSTQAKSKTVVAPVPHQADTTNLQGRVDTIYQMGRVDTVYLQTPSTTHITKTKPEKSNDYATGSDLKSQQAEINRLEKEIENLRKQRGKDAAKVAGAGVAGAVVGAAVSNKKSEKDTVYVERNTETARIDSLERELELLKLQYENTSPSDSGYVVPNPPIGQYFSGKDTTHTSSDSLALPPDSMSVFPDSIHRNVSEAMIELDTLSPSQEAINEILNEDNDVKTKTIRNDTISEKPEKEAESTKEKAIEKPKSSKASLKGEYPVVCNFALNQSKPSQEELEKLDVVISDLKGDKNRRVILTGFTDKSGKADYNLALSKKRAASIEAALISKGIDEKRIEINAGGELDSADKYSPNARRVELKIVEE